MTGCFSVMVKILGKACGCIALKCLIKEEPRQRPPSCYMRIYQNMTKTVADIFDDFRTVYDRRLSMHAGVKWCVSNKTITTAMLC